MGATWDYITGKTGRKIKKTKQKVKDVQALHSYKRGNTPRNQSGMVPVNRAAARLGVNPGTQYPSRGKKGGSGVR